MPFDELILFAMATEGEVQTYGDGLAATCRYACDYAVIHNADR